MAYTPGLTVTDVTVVRKQRRLPLPGDVLVKVGDVVAHNKIVAVTKIPGAPEIVKVAWELGIDPRDEKIEPFMLKKLGDEVEEGEEIAMSTSFIFFKKYSRAPIKGTIELISNYTGQVIVRGTPLPVEVDAYIPGTIVEVVPSEGVIVETPAAYVQGIFGIGGEAHGALLTVADSPDDALTAEKISPDHAGKILVGGAIVTSDALKKAVEVGVNGIVVGGIQDTDLVNFMGYEVGVAITGQEELGITLILTEGFGHMKMSAKTFRILHQHNGELTCINGATQIRAGVMRPEIIVPLKAGESKQATVEEASQVGLEPGTPIRVIREPYFGALGYVSSLPIELQLVETGSSVRVVELTLEDGRTVVVPRANVEMIDWKA